MEEHSKGSDRIAQCRAVRIKPHAKCDGGRAELTLIGRLLRRAGYCCRRCPLAFDSTPRRVQFGGKYGGMAHVARKSWMMQEPLSSYWRIEGTERRFPAVPGASATSKPDLHVSVARAAHCRSQLQAAPGVR
eukprot:1396345-Prymnesium_polylepis.2